MSHPDPAVPAALESERAALDAVPRPSRLPSPRAALPSSSLDLESCPHVLLDSVLDSDGDGVLDSGRDNDVDVLFFGLDSGSERLEMGAPAPSWTLHRPYLTSTLASVDVK